MTTPPWWSVALRSFCRRDGVTKDGEKGQVYSAERDMEDGRAFLERGTR